MNYFWHQTAVEKRQFAWRNCLHSLKLRRQRNLKYQQNIDKSFSFLEVCRPEQERCAIALARTHTSHIKNTRVKCCTPRKLYIVSPHLLLIQLFSTFLIHIFLLHSLNVLYAFTEIVNLVFFHIITFRRFTSACYLFHLNSNP